MRNPPPTAIITGSSRGLGAATALAAARLGAAVVLAGRQGASLQKVAAEIEAQGGLALPVPGDLCQPGHRQQLVEAALRRFGRLDALVNNAGVLEPIALIADGHDDDWEHNLAVNLLASVALTRLALPHLRRSSGRVINVSSGAAVTPMAGWGAYCVAKAGLNHFTRVLAEEERNITALAVRPGVVDTAMQAVIRTQGRAAMPPEEHRRFLDYHRRGELLPPEKPGLSLAVLAFEAPADWSGEFVRWDEERVMELVARRAGGAAAG